MSQNSEIENAREQERKCKMVVQACIVKEIPSKKKKTAEIQKLLNLGTGYRDNRDYFIRAHALSKKVFGIDLYVDQESDRIYLLKSDKAKELEDKVGKDRGVQSSTSPKKHLVFILLNAIFLSNGEITKDKILKIFERFGIHDDQNNKLFENKKSATILSKFVQDNYLEHDKEKWGSRAKMEIDPQSLLKNYVENFSKDKSISMLQIHYQKQINDIMAFRAASHTASGNKLLQWADSQERAQERRNVANNADVTAQPNLPAKRTRKK